MAVNRALVLMVAPLSIVLSGCIGNQGATPGSQPAGALLGAAAQAFAAFSQGNGQGAPAPQPIADAFSANLPGLTLSSGVGAQSTPGPFEQQPLTLGSGVTGGSSAANNAFTLASTAGQIGAGTASDGRLTLTQYGGPTDRTPDANTQAGIGNRNNRLRSTSLALAPNLIREYGLRGGEEIYVKTARGNFFLGTYDDTTGNTREPNVIDVYDPTDRLGRDNFIASVPPGGWQLAIGQRQV